VIEVLFPLGGFALLLGGWMVAALLVGSGPDEGGGGAERFGTATGGLAWGIAVACLSALGLGLWSLASGADPGAAVLVPLATPPDPGDVLRVCARLTGGFGLASAVGVVGWGAVAGRRVRRMGLALDGVDFAGVCAAALFGVGIVVLLLANPRAWGVSVPLELAALAPLVSVALVLSLLAKPSSPDPAPAMGRGAVVGSAARGALMGPRPVPARSSVDPLPRLAAAGLAAGTPDCSWSPRRRGGVSDPDATRLWAAVGGLGDPPEALVESLRRLERGGSVLVPDVPGRIERTLLAAILVGVLVDHAGRAFAITREPQVLRDLVLRGIRSLGHWPPGPLCADVKELHDATSARRLPAALFLEPSAANSRGVSYIADQGQEFGQQLSALVVSRPDLLDPIASTHLYFTVKRLRLQTGPLAAVVTAHGTAEILSGIDAMLGATTERVPLRPAQTEAVRICRGLASGGMKRDSILKAIRATLALLGSAGVETSLEDMAEFLSAEDLGEDLTRVELDPPGTLRGDVCLLVTRDEWLGPVYRLAENRAPSGTTWGQLIIWWVLPSPLTNFLLEGDRLKGQFREGLLPAPAPLFARDNRYLQKLHLLASLHEGTPEEHRLRGTFGASQVTNLIEQDKATRVSEQADLDSGGIVRRSAVLAPARGQERPDTSRQTITAAEIRVVDRSSGAVLARLDKLTAQTHYYPHRVFGSRGRRYQVLAGGGYDPGSATISVDPVGNERQPTIPSLKFHIEHQEWIGERDSRKQDDLVIQAGQARVLVREFVARSLDQTGDSHVELDRPVQSNYRTRVKVIWLKHHGPLGDEWAYGLAHVARLMDDVLVAHLRCLDENIEVEPRIGGYESIDSPALLVIDRHVGGAGVADALTLDVIVRSLRWVQAVMKSCRCDHGCRRCVPPEVARLAAKNEAIALLGN
jgi:hypothetical protein